MDFDVAIIGAGPAGLTAGIFASRAGLKTVCFERLVAGGQASLSSSIENYPGFENITGFELSTKFMQHSVSAGVTHLTEDVQKVEQFKSFFKITTSKNVYKVKKVIVACGCKARRLGIPNEEELIGKGISYCASCDGMFFKNKTVAVVGGGDSAVDNVDYLTRLCKKIYVLNRSEKFRAGERELKRIKGYKNVEVLTNATVKELLGDDVLQGVKIKHNDEIQKLKIDGLFVAIGYVPEFSFLKIDVEKDEMGYIKVNEHQQTSVKNLFACGDVTSKSFKQVITACADGARAGNSCVGV